VDNPLSRVCAMSRKNVVKEAVEKSAHYSVQLAYERKKELEGEHAGHCAVMASGLR
jgi:hypothetical protein